MVWCATQLTPASDYFAVILPALLVAGVGSGLVFVAATAVAVHGVAPATAAPRPACSPWGCRWGRRSD
jgi:hypothetical protein